jgi:hypothetical protein
MIGGRNLQTAQMLFVSDPRIAGADIVNTPAGAE